MTAGSNNQTQTEGAEREAAALMQKRKMDITLEVRHRLKGVRAADELNDASSIHLFTGQGISLLTEITCCQARRSEVDHLR